MGGGPVAESKLRAIPDTPSRADRASCVRRQRDVLGSPEVFGSGLDRTRVSGRAWRKLEPE